MDCARDDFLKYVADAQSGVLYTNIYTNLQSVVFYWADGASNRVVQCSAKVNGQTVTAKTTFNVLRPTAKITTTGGTVALDLELFLHNTSLRSSASWVCRNVIFKYSSRTTRLFRQYQFGMGSENFVFVAAGADKRRSCLLVSSASLKRSRCSVSISTRFPMLLHIRFPCQPGIISLPSGFIFRQL